MVIASKKLEEVAYSPQKAGSPRKLPSQASKDGFHYMTWRSFAHTWLGVYTWRAVHTWPVTSVARDNTYVYE